MEKIIVISQYPDQINIKDGMLRRVNEIDKKLEKNYYRIYLDISFKRNFKSYSKKNQNLEVHKLNFFKDFFFILKIIRQNEKIYIHSIHNYLKIFLIPNLKTKKIILDVHGIVPEENEFEGKISMAKVFNFLENKLFKKLTKIIFVTNQMKKFYEKKYSNQIKKIESEILPIIESKREIKVTKVNDNLNLKNKTIVIYSGNLQKWQNIDLMLEEIKKNDSGKLFYIFLTGQKEEMEKKFKEYQINPENYLIDSVQPNELGQYYNIANYGFVLRDDHILNRVANPTKLGEYLDYGIIPIVKLEEIGDYKEMGYEYITLSNFNENLSKIKSKKNVEIMKNYRKKLEEIDFVDFIES